MCDSAVLLVVAGVNLTAATLSGIMATIGGRGGRLHGLLAVLNGAVAGAALILCLAIRTPLP